MAFQRPNWGLRANRLLRCSNICAPLARLVSCARRAWEKLSLCKRKSPTDRPLAVGVRRINKKDEAHFNSVFALSLALSQAAEFGQKRARRTIMPTLGLETSNELKEEETIQLCQRWRNITPGASDFALQLASRLGEVITAIIVEPASLAFWAPFQLAILWCARASVTTLVVLGDEECALIVRAAAAAAAA